MKSIGKFAAVAASLAAVCLGVGSAHATPTDNSGSTTNSSPAKIAQVSTSDTTWSKVWLQAPFCGPQVIEFWISKSHPAHSQMYQTVLAAFLAAKPVNLRWENGTAGQCWVKAVTVLKDP